MWLDLLVSALFGILEGVTEWLPVSSTGHLILLAHLLGRPWRDAFFELFEVVIQLAAIAAVLLCYRRRLTPFGHEKDRAARAAVWRLWRLLLLATLPAAVLGVLLDDVLDAYLYHPLTVALTLILYGIVFLLLERRRGAKPLGEDAEMTARRALAIGGFQALALIPGTSRSGASVIGGLCMGLSRADAAEFSFLLAIPTMLGAGALKVFKFFAQGDRLLAGELAILAVGCLTAFLLSVLSMRALLSFVRRHSFLPFGVYRILLGALILFTLI